MDLGLHDKSALVCASSKGLGFAVAKSLADEGAHVLLCARSDDELRKAADTLRATTKGKVFYKTCDLMVPAEVQALIQYAQNTVGDIDILINNVGGPSPTKALETNTELWRDGFERLFVPSAHLTNSFLPAMIERRFGRVVNITSLSVLEPVDTLAISNAIRAAVSANAKTLAREVAPYGVTVNNVMPGIIHTDRINYLRTKAAERLGTSLEDEMKKTLAPIPMGRMGKPEEFAALVCFLCSPQAAYITGANIPVDGGARKGWH